MNVIDPFRSPQRATERYTGRYRGTVVDVEDPKTLGRLKLKVPEVLEDLDSGWALPSFAVTGDGCGLYGIPPIGAGVWVEFEAGDLSRPVWVGGWFAEGSLPEGATPEKMILRTPGGAVVTLDDEAGEVEIAESGGNKVVINADGIELSAGGKMIAITSKSVTINDGALEVT